MPKEYKLSNEGIIVSKTDLKGRLTYANRYFMEVVDLPESDLLGKPHNIIRHADMPRGVFYLLWKTLQQRKEFFGYVKNISAGGGYYWVLANITPDIRTDLTLDGYFSVRRRPNYAAVQKIQDLYKQMLNLEALQSASQAAKVSAEWLLEQIAKQGCTYNEFIWQLEDLSE